MRQYLLKQSPDLRKRPRELRGHFAYLVQPAIAIAAQTRKITDSMTRYCMDVHACWNYMMFLLVPF